MAKRDEYVAPVAVEDLDKVADGVAVDIDWTEDAWSYGAPPPWDEYKFKLFFDKEGIVSGYDNYINGKPDEKTIYFQFNLIAKITEGEFEGVPVYTKVNTKMYRGKGISTAAGLLSKMVDTSKLPKQLTPKQIAKLIKQVMSKEPTVRAELDWRGSYQYKDSKGEDQWENHFRRSADFPLDPETKERMHVCKVNNKYRSIPGNSDQVEVSAQTQIVRFFGKGEKLVKPTQRVNGTQQAAGRVNVANVPELVIDGPGVKIHTPVANVASVQEDDLSLLLDS